MTKPLVRPSEGPHESIAKGENVLRPSIRPFDLRFSPPPPTISFSDLSSPLRAPSRTPFPRWSASRNFCPSTNLVICPRALRPIFLSRYCFWIDIGRVVGRKDYSSVVKIDFESLIQKLAKDRKEELFRYRNLLSQSFALYFSSFYNCSFVLFRSRRTC